MQNVTKAGDLCARIEQTFGAAKLIGWQFAEGGHWEACEQLFFEHTPVRMSDAALQWLQHQQSGDIAFEALFKLAGDECFFFGVHLARLELKAKESVLRQLLAACQKNDSPSQVIQKTRAALASPLLMGLPECLELGVFNLWNRVKPLTVWKQHATPKERAGLLPPEEIKDWAQAPDEGFAFLDEPQPMPLILEAIWRKSTKPWQDYQYWISLPVSHYDSASDSYVLSPERYFQAAHTLALLREPALA